MFSCGSTQDPFVLTTEATWYFWSSQGLGLVIRSHQSKKGSRTLVKNLYNVNGVKHFAMVILPHHNYWLDTINYNIIVTKNYLGGWHSNNNNHNNFGMVIIIITIIIERYYYNIPKL